MLLFPNLILQFVCVFFAGAFLVPYILMVFVIGLPLFFAELFVGQYSGLGPTKVYQRLAPFFHGKYILYTSPTYNVTKNDI